jgi:hypothetical protein
LEVLQEVAAFQPKLHLSLPVPAVILLWEQEEEVNCPLLRQIQQALLVQDMALEVAGHLLMQLPQTQQVLRARKVIWSSMNMLNLKGIEHEQ